MPPKSRKVTAVVRIQQPAGAANVAKVGQVLGAYGINIVQVMKDFNEATEQYRGTKIVGKVPSSVLQNVARQKFPDLNTEDLDQAVKIVAGSVRSMGLAVED